MFLRFRRATPVANLKQGAVAVISGRVAAKTELSLIGSGTRCVFYDLTIESFRKADRGAGRPMWLPERHERRCTGFWVDDGSGKVWIGTDAEVLDVGGAKAEAGAADRTGIRRYAARLIRAGDTVKLHGLVALQKGRKGEPSTLALVPGPNGRIEMLVRPGKP